MAKNILGKELETPPEDDLKFGLNYPRGYVLDRFGDWHASNRQVYPNGKPRDEQPPNLMEDFYSLAKRLNYQVSRLRERK